MSDVTNLLQNAQELVVSAGNGTLDDSSRRAIATELRGNLDELLGLANRTDGNGQYLFSGFQGSTKPFADTGAGIQYSGDEGLRMIQASASRQLAVNESGKEVFERVPASGGGYQSMFKTLTDLINTLETPVVTPADKTTLLPAWILPKSTSPMHWTMCCASAHQPERAPRNWIRSTRVGTTWAFNINSSFPTCRMWIMPKPSAT